MEKTGLFKALRPTGLLLVFVGVYLVLHIAGNALYFEPENVATFWPGSGYFLALLLIVPYRKWPLVICGGMLVQGFSDIVIYERHVLTSFLFWIANGAEGVIGALLLRRFYPSFSITRVRHFLGFLGLAAGVSAGISALLGAAVVTVLYGTPYWSMWQVWWFADALGMIVVAPFILGWAEPARQGTWQLVRMRKFELILLLTTVIGGSLMIFGRYHEHLTWIIEFPYFIFLLIIWSAFRFDQRITAILFLGCVVMLLVNANFGRGPFMLDELNTHQNVLAIQAFIATLVIMPSLMGGVLKERREAEKQILADLREKETLIKELYHRTKNNMQVVGSLLHLQAQSTGSPDVRAELEAAGERIKSMALVHKKLYQSKSLSRISLKGYVDDLVQLIRSSHGMDGTGITILQEVQDIEVVLDVAVPVGLVLNELISNSIRHAFPEKRGEVSLTITQTDHNRIHIRVADNGCGLPDGFDAGNTSSLGFQIIHNIVEIQLSGTVAFISGNGLTCSIEFENILYNERV